MSMCYLLCSVDNKQRTIHHTPYILRILRTLLHVYVFPHPEARDPTADRPKTRLQAGLVSIPRASKSP